MKCHVIQGDSACSGRPPGPASACKLARPSWKWAREALETSVAKNINSFHPLGVRGRYLDLISCSNWSSKWSVFRRFSFLPTFPFTRNKAKERGSQMKIYFMQLCTFSPFILLIIIWSVDTFISKQMAGQQGKMTCTRSQSNRMRIGNLGNLRVYTFNCCNKFCVKGGFDVKWPEDRSQIRFQAVSAFQRLGFPLCKGTYLNFAE